jgi:C-terminal processing protease CtpA/Prc
MALLANTDALIIDLRANGGGSPEMVQYLCSYFFEGEPVHLNDLYFRPENETRQFWTLSWIPGRRYVGKPLYLLTSSRTFSGAEEFAYDMQTQKRATIVGETTGGGANPGGPVDIAAGFEVFVPMGRAINPVTQTNWEGKGVEPEVKCAAAEALVRAHKLALQGLLEKAEGPRRQQLEEALAALQ